jgi:hypothetical protein
LHAPNNKGASLEASLILHLVIKPDPEKFDKARLAWENLARTKTLSRVYKVNEKSL